MLLLLPKVVAFLPNAESGSRFSVVSLTGCINTVAHSAMMTTYCDDTVYIKPLTSPQPIEEANADLGTLLLLTCFSNLLLILNPAKSKFLVVSADSTR